MAKKVVKKNVAKSRAKARATASEGKAKAKHTATLVALEPIALEINVRLEKAENAEGQAFDHRLAASLNAADAKKRCEKVGIKFKGWCDDNLKQTYDTVRKLATIGAAGSPAKVKIALEDFRARTAKHNRDSRARKAASSSASAPASSNVGVQVPDSCGSVERVTATPFSKAFDAVRLLPETDRVQLAREVIIPSGMSVVTKDVAHRANLAGDDLAENIKLSFDRLGEAQRRAFVDWAARRCDGTVSWPAKAEETGDPLDIPPMLDRRKSKKGGKGKSKKAAKA